MINTNISATNKSRLLECYNLDLSTFITNNVPIVLNYLVKNTFSAYNFYTSFDIAVKPDGIMIVGNLDIENSMSNANTYSRPTRIELKPEKGIVTSLKQKAYAIVVEYCNWLKQIILLEQNANANTLKDILLGKTMVKGINSDMNTQVPILFSSQACIDWVLANLSELQYDDNIDTTYLLLSDYYLVDKLLATMPTYHKLTTSIINMLISVVSNLVTDKICTTAKFQLLIRQLCQLLITSDNKDYMIIYNAPIAYNTLWELISKLRYQKLILPLSAFPALYFNSIYLKDKKLSSTLNKIIFTAQSKNDVNQFFHDCSVANINMTLKEIKQIIDCNNCFNLSNQIDYFNQCMSKYVEEAEYD